VRHEGGVHARCPPANLLNWNRNEHYKSAGEYLYALAEALAHEYRAISMRAWSQVDDPLLASIP